jgi:hypothetical protein
MTASDDFAMTSNGERWARDTSVAVAALDPAYPVLTRLPFPLRLSTDHAVSVVASVANGRTLLTRDRRAERTYRSLQVEYRFVG